MTGNPIERHNNPRMWMGMVAKSMRNVNINELQNIAEKIPLHLAQRWIFLPIIETLIVWERSYRG
jgi:hypothetical protein